MHRRKKEVKKFSERSNQQVLTIGGNQPAGSEVSEAVRGSVRCADCLAVLAINVESACVIFAGLPGANEQQ